MRARARSANRRNDRHWFEWGDMCALDVTSRGTVLVSICGVSEYQRGEVIYTVEEACSGMRYPAAAESLRLVKDYTETCALIQAGRERGETRGGPLPAAPEVTSG